MFKKLTLAAAVASAVAAGPALAVPTTVNALDGAGGTIAANVTEFDWNSGSTAAAIGKGPFGSDPSAAPNPFTFLYQSVLVAFNDQNLDPITPAAGLNGTFGTGGYEFTVVANISEFAVVTSPTSASFTPVGGKVSIYFDNTASGGVKANSATGAGFADGVEVARFTVTGGTSVFTVINPTTGLGATSFNFGIIAALDFVDANYIEGIVGPVLSMNFQSTQNFPPIQAIPTQYFAGSTNALYTPYTPDQDCTDGACDLFLKVDGSSRFGAPEPGMLSLLAGGLLAFGFAARRGKRA